MERNFTSIRDSKKSIDQDRTSKYIASDYTTRNSAILPGQRLLDVMLALLGIVFVLSWLLPVLGLIISLSSKGPVLSIQVRKGRRGKPFSYLKLRTTIYRSRPAFYFSQQPQEQFTRPGAWLHRTRLDRLPQLINVLQGDMSLFNPSEYPVHYAGRDEQISFDSLSGVA